MKFGQNPHLRSFLLETQGKVIAEASPVDKVWGVGLQESDRSINDPDQWKGENLLGFALMEVRDKLM